MSTELSPGACTCRRYCSQVAGPTPGQLSSPTSASDPWAGGLSGSVIGGPVYSIPAKQSVSPPLLAELNWLCAHAGLSAQPPAAMLTTSNGPVTATLVTFTTTPGWPISPRHWRMMHSSLPFVVSALPLPIGNAGNDTATIPL